MPITLLVTKLLGSNIKGKMKNTIAAKITYLTAVSKVVSEKTEFYLCGNNKSNSTTCKHWSSIHKQLLLSHISKKDMINNYKAPD